MVEHKVHKVLGIRKRTWQKVGPVKLQLELIKGTVSMDEVVDFLYRMADLDMSKPLDSDPRARETLRLMALEEAEAE